MTSLERAMKYANATPPAISGAGGHNQTFALACSLYNGFALTESETLAVLKIFNFKCQPPWSEAELSHKVRQSAAVTHNRPRGHLLNDKDGFPVQERTETPPIRLDPATAIEKLLRGFRCTEAELWEASPIRPPDDWTQDGICLLQTCFRPLEKVNFVTAFSERANADGTVKANPAGAGETVDRDELVDRWQTKGMPQSKAGGWMRINPVDGGIRDTDVTSFRHALIEFDRIPLDLQISVVCKLPLPIAAVLTSGGKSIHAWVKVAAADMADYEIETQELRKVLKPIGMDEKNKNPSRLSRLVGVTRTIGATGDGRQRLLYLNRNPGTKPIIP